MSCCLQAIRFFLKHCIALGFETCRCTSEKKQHHTSHGPRQWSKKATASNRRQQWLLPLEETHISDCRLPGWRRRTLRLHRDSDCSLFLVGFPQEPFERVHNSRKPKQIKKQDNRDCRTILLWSIGLKWQKWTWKVLSLSWNLSGSKIYCKTIKNC